MRSGMTAAIEAAEYGKQVILLEKNASVGERVSQLYKYFPKLCIPTCGMEINLRRMKVNRNLRLMTLAKVVKVDRVSGDYTVTVKIAPRSVNENCTGYGDCANAVSTEFDDEFNYGMKQRKGAYLISPDGVSAALFVGPAHSRYSRWRKSQGRVQVQRNQPEHE